LFMFDIGRSRNRYNKYLIQASKNITNMWMMVKRLMVIYLLLIGAAKL
jgi:hypothetical protein